MDDLSIESIFGDSEIEIECPSCNNEFEIKLGEVMESGNTVTCPNCNQEITIAHDETTEQTMKESNKALKDFEKTLRSIK